MGGKAWVEEVVWRAGKWETCCWYSQPLRVSTQQVPQHAWHTRLFPSSGGMRLHQGPALPLQTKESRDLGPHCIQVLSQREISVCMCLGIFRLQNEQQQIFQVVAILTMPGHDAMEGLVWKLKQYRVLAQCCNEEWS